MIPILIGFFLGFMVFPLLYACIPPLIGGLAAKKRYKPGVRSGLYISKDLKKEIRLSMTLTSSLGWMNVLIQRMYHDMAQNHCFENGIRQSILRSFSAVVGNGLVRNVKIKHLEFGVEAPYLKCIKLISKEEYRRLTKWVVSDLRSCAEQISQDLQKINSAASTGTIVEMHKKYTKSSFCNGRTINFSSLTNLTGSDVHGTGVDNPIIEMVAEENLEKQPMGAPVSADEYFSIHLPSESSEHLISLHGNEEALDSVTKNREIADDIGDVGRGKTSHRGIDREQALDSDAVEFTAEELEETNFQEVYRNCTFLGHLTYSGGMKVAAEIELPKGVVMSAIVVVKRVASDFLFRMPAENYTTRYEVSLINNPLIEVEVESGLDTGYKKTFFQSSVSNFLKRSALSSIKNAIVYPCWYQMVQPFAASPRSVSFYPSRISVSSMDRAVDDGEKIMAIVGCDFKIVSQKSNMFCRKSLTILNDQDHISMWDFAVPPHLSEICKPSPHGGLSTEESRLLRFFETLEIFRNIIPGFKEARLIGRRGNVSMVKILVYDSEIDFVRIVCKRHIVFYKNVANACEFFVFKIQEGVLQIFNFTGTFGLCLNNGRVEKLMKKIYSGPIKVPVERGSRQQGALAEKNMTGKDRFTGKLEPDQWNNVSSTDSEDSELYSRRVELENMFEQALRLSSGEFSSYEIAIDIGSRKLKEYLGEDYLRMKMVPGSGQIVSSFNESRHIKTLVVKGTSTAEMTFHSFFSDKFVIDVCPSDQLILIYRIGRSKRGGGSGSGRARLQILYRSSFQIKFPNYFIESLKIRESYQKYFSVCDETEYLRSPLQIQKEMGVSGGTIYFEFRTDLEDDFHLELFSCKRQKVLFDVCGVVSNRIFRLVYPVENDYVKISLIPKYRKNEVIEYKAIGFPYTRNVLVEGMIGLDRDHKFRVAIQGSHTHVIFWERGWDLELKSHIHNSESKIDIGNCGILRSEEREYILVHKNKTAKKRNIQISAGLTELH